MTLVFFVIFTVIGTMMSYVLVDTAFTEYPSEGDSIWSSPITFITALFCAAIGFLGIVIILGCKLWRLV